MIGVVTDQLAPAGFVIVEPFWVTDMEQKRQINRGSCRRQLLVHGLAEAPDRGPWSELAQR